MKVTRRGLANVIETTGWLLIGFGLAHVLEARTWGRQIRAEEAAAPTTAAAEAGA